MDRDYRDRCRQPMQAIISAAGNIGTAWAHVAPHVSADVSARVQQSVEIIERQIKRLDAILSE